MSARNARSRTNRAVRAGQTAHEMHVCSIEHVHTCMPTCAGVSKMHSITAALIASQSWPLSWLGQTSRVLERGGGGPTWRSGRRP